MGGLAKMKENERDINVIDLREKAELLSTQELFPLEEIGKIMYRHMEDRQNAFEKINKETDDYIGELEKVFYNFRKAASKDKQLKEYMRLMKELDLGK